jgi:HSP20 family molecular chaperone IbpA
MPSLFPTPKELDYLFGNLGSGKISRYPLTNIGTDSDNVLYIEVAIAGFSKEDIDLEMNGNYLHIIGTAKKQDNKVNYYQQYISSKDFERILSLDEKYVEGDLSATIEDGILKITIQPKEPRKKLIEIK